MNIGRSQNPAERLASASAGANKPSACSACGSTFLYEVSAYQYSVSQYGARVVGISPQKLFVCPCGEPMVTSNTQSIAPTGGERASFLESLNLAKAYREKNNPINLIKNTASVSELSVVRDEIEEVKARLAELLELLTQAEDESIEIESEVEEPIEKITRQRGRKSE